MPRQIYPAVSLSKQKYDASRQMLCPGGFRFVAILLTISLSGALSPLALADTGSEPPHAQPHALNIVILEGEGALNNIRERDAREPIVQVQDENHKPVAGALVLFAVNDSGGGAGAAFNGLQTLSVTTGPDGIARAEGFLPNNVSGRYTLTVRATLLTMAASILIYQSNIISPLPGQTPQAASPASHGFGHTLAHSGLAQGIIAGVVVAGVAVLGATYSDGGGTNTKPGRGKVPPGQ